MEGEGEGLDQKRVASLSTVSLDSTYGHVDGESVTAEKQPLHSRCAWTPLVVLVALVLVAVALVLALDRGKTREIGVAEGDPSTFGRSSLTNGQGLTAPQKTLVEWLKQARNASELNVAGGSSNMSLNGVLFPRNDSDTLPPFDAMVVINSGVALSTREYVALASGRGYKWVETSLDYGDSIVTNGCLISNSSLPFDEFNSVVSTANWTSTDDKSEVNVVLGGENYTVSKEDYDYGYDYDLDETEDTLCWLIESEDEDLGLRVCTLPSTLGQLPETDFADLFNATNECPQLAPNTTRSRTHTKFVVPLPLRKWYASYKAYQ